MIALGRPNKRKAQTIAWDNSNNEVTSRTTGTMKSSSNPDVRNYSITCSKKENSASSSLVFSILLDASTDWHFTSLNTPSKFVLNKSKHMKNLSHKYYQLWKGPDIKKQASTFFFFFYIYSMLSLPQHN